MVSDAGEPSAPTTPQRSSIVKILDLGLARLGQATERGDSTVTQEGAVLGTPDFIAPEQAREAHGCDHRADLYSLGCTFYYLLTGQVPFPGGTLTQKLLQHQLEEPAPVERLRPDVPLSVASVVRQLMAKRPEDRYASAGELALALSFAGPTHPTNIVSATGGILSKADGSGGDTATHWSSIFDPPSQRVAAGARPQLLPPPISAPWLAFYVGGIAGLLMALGIFLYLLLRDSGQPSQVVKEEPAPTIAFKKKPPPKLAVDDAWLKSVAALSVEKQVDAVTKKLQELNPGFDGKVTHKSENGVVTELQFLTDDVTNISPLHALKDLKVLTCAGSGEGRGKLVDLSPIRGMPLTSLDCHWTAVSDLSPLKGMSLRTLHCASTKVWDLSPLEHMPLTTLHCFYTSVADLKPLEGMPLKTLGCFGTPVSDLSPLKDAPLEFLDIHWTKVSDLTPLKGLPLKSLTFHDTAVTDLSPLHGMQLTSLSCGSTQVRDLSPLAGMPLTAFFCQSTLVSDLSPCQKMPLLRQIWCDFRPFRDTEILRAVKSLERINEKPAAEFWKEVDDRQAKFEAWTKEVAALPAENQAQAVTAKLRELNPGFDGKVTHKIDNGVVTELHFVTDHVTDLSPVRALPGLKVLECSGSGYGKSKLSDLSPLKGLKLTYLRCYFTALADLSPLHRMPIWFLEFYSTLVSDISPLKDMPLGHLNCSTLVADLSPLQGMRLGFLGCARISSSDQAILQDMPLKHLFADCRGAEFLRSIKTLETINGKPAAEFWKEVDDRQAKFDAWTKKVATLPPEKQVEMVAGKLQELNPGFDGKVTHKGQNAQVTELVVETDQVTDLSPLRALPNLHHLGCSGSGPGKSRLPDGQFLVIYWQPVGNGQGVHRFGDLSPLKSSKLTNLDCSYSRVSDLSPLKGMPLAALVCASSRVSDLTPLKGMPLVVLNCNDNPIADLSPLKDTPLVYLRADFTKISDLSPLTGMKLRQLSLSQTAVADLSPLKGMKLTSLSCWRTKVTDLTPLAGMPLTSLDCSGTKVSDLWPLRGTKLQHLSFADTAVADLSPLKGMKLTSLDCWTTKIIDLTPLAGMPLSRLVCSNTKITDLSPLKGMPLNNLICQGTQVSDLSPLKGMPLQHLHCDFKPERDTEILQSITTLVTINDKPAKEFWKEVGQRKAGKTP